VRPHKKEQGKATVLKKEKELKRRNWKCGGKKLYNMVENKKYIYIP